MPLLVYIFSHLIHWQASFLSFIFHVNISLLGRCASTIRNACELSLRAREHLLLCVCVCVEGGVSECVYVCARAHALACLLCTLARC